MDMKDIEQKIEDATQLLEAIVDDRALLVDLDDEKKKRFLMAAGRVSRPGKYARKALRRAKQKKRKQEERQADQQLLDKTGIREARKNPIFETPRRMEAFREANGSDDSGEASTQQATKTSTSIGQTAKERSCYVCGEEFRDVHFFYDQLCLECGDFNYAKRFQSADLSGRVALVTGGRVKIGYQAALMLLRAGAEVICTTRFPNDATERYGAEDDFEQWGDRLQIYGLDFRHTPSVEAFCRTLNRRLPRLDFIINNACQTVRRPAGFYDHLMERELSTDELSDEQRKLLGRLDETAGRTSDRLVTPETPAALLSQVELLAEDKERGNHLFPKGQLDADLQQVDLRKVNSWRLKTDEVSAIELLEVHLVNAVAPFIINARLKPLMVAVPTEDKHIVNVSAMEGQFYRIFKTDRHPHTNMAKAALNMMTRTSAMDYVDDGIHMNSVDTGWVTDEDPAHHAAKKREIHDFHPPLDIVDGAARIVDPIFDGINTGEHIWGQFLKDYEITDW